MPQVSERRLGNGVSVGELNWRTLKNASKRRVMVPVIRLIQDAYRSSRYRSSRVGRRMTVYGTKRVSKALGKRLERWWRNTHVKWRPIIV